MEDLSCSVYPFAEEVFEFPLDDIEAISTLSQSLFFTSKLLPATAESIISRTSATTTNSFHITAFPYSIY
jgi:hypothetical protein